MIIKECELERYFEGDLDFKSLFLLYSLCNYDVSSKRIDYLVSLYNNGCGGLEEAEKCYLINYVLTGRSSVGNKYKLYNVNGEKLILSEAEINAKGYQVLIKPATEEECIKQVISELENNGFQFLSKDPDEIIAINRDRNIVFYCNDINNYCSDNYMLFQSPRRIEDSLFREPYTNITMYKSLNQIPEKKVDFPLFTDSSGWRLGIYLWLFNRVKDQDEPFVASMKRIARYPELYDLVGPHNQQMISDLIGSEEINVGKMLKRTPKKD